MKAIKLIALDMDGTLLTEEKLISPLTREWLERAMQAGIAVCFATGRGYASAMPYARELGLKTPMVLVNGGEVWTGDGRLHSRHAMAADDVRRLHAIAVRHDTWFWAYNAEGVRNKDNWTGRVDGHEWLKFGYYTEDDAVREHIVREIAAWGTLEMTNSHPCNVELNPLGVNKASGLREACGLLGITMANVAAAGDSLNDLAMIREAGLGAAMGNAQAEVRAAADVVLPTNEEDGIAALIRDHILGL